MAELKIDDLKPVKSEEVKEPAAHEKAAEKLKESVRELHAGDSKSELEKTADKITGAFKKASKKAKDTVDGVITEETRARFDLLAAAAAELQDLGNSIFYGEAPTPEQAKQAIEAGDEYAIFGTDELVAMDETERELRAKQHDINVLRAELQDKVAELRDLKKNISKMQQTHEAELQDLKDQLGEAQAEAAAAKKAHAHAVGEKNNYADTLDNDSIAFEEIRALAIIMDRNAKSLHELAKMVQERTEV